MVFGLSLGTSLAMAAGLFYIIHHIIVKSALFIAVGIVELRSGSGKLGVAQGVLHLDPTAATAFLLLAMALAGIPPLSGFWAKLFLIVAGFQTEAWLATGLAIFVGLLTLASMLKIWNASYWGDSSQSVWLPVPQIHRLHRAALGLAAVSLITGLLALPLFQFFGQHAANLLSGTAYISAVMDVDRSSLKGGEP
jgi:multicomponent Na+:H+ antiporter subunit D